MCWIFAYKWSKDACDILLNWLSRLEYRWYDSAGLVVLDNHKNVFEEKSIGKVSNLASKVENSKQATQNFRMGIAHTRWATHGGVTLENTHPHHSRNSRFYLVYNGIIENYLDIKKNLEKKWYDFYGNTDSEIVAKLIEDMFDGDLESTLKKVKEVITWAYALVVIDTHHPDKIIALKLGSPLVLWLKNDEFYLSSDSNALGTLTDYYIPIDDHEMVVISWDTYKILSANKEIQKEKLSSVTYSSDNDMGDFNHYMEKEIFETPVIIENILWGRVDFEKYSIQSNALEKLDITSIKKIEFIASGTSYNAGMVGVHLFEELAWIQSQIHIASEFKYKKQFIDKETLYVFISQSGETADSLECLKLVKNRWWQTFGVVNVVGSSIARLCDNGLYTHCWVEIGVAATKTFIWQVLTLLIVALYMGNKLGLDYTTYRNILSWLEHLKDDIHQVLLQSRKVDKVSRKYAKYSNMFFLGKNIFYPLAMEWSLKCKEITYHHTESYSSGELKHGPLSLIEKNFPTLLINPENPLYQKNISTLKEIQARNGKVIWLISQNDPHAKQYDDTIEVPKSTLYNSLFTSSIALQLFAYYMAKKLGREIDKPRNLAKSVTVE